MPFLPPDKRIPASYDWQDTMDKLQTMNVFISVARAGSFTRAAQLESLNTTAVSRAIMQLEKELQIRLLNRTTRRLSLTEAGKRYLERCERIAEQVEFADSEARSAAAEPRGRLRIQTTANIGQHYLIPGFAQYMDRFPEVSLELTINHSAPNRIDDSVDVAIVAASKLRDSMWIAQRVGTERSILCASPGYLARYGKPSTIEDLRSHACLMPSPDGASSSGWSFDDASMGDFYPTNVIPLFLDSDETRGAAICADMGVGMLPVPIAARGIRQGTLVPVFPRNSTSSSNVYVMYQTRKFLDAKIKTLIEFLTDFFPDQIRNIEQQIHPLESMSPRGSGLRSCTLNEYANAFRESAQPC